MTRSLDALYERYGIDPGALPAGDSAQLSALIAKNVNGALFRQELARLADEMVQMRESLEALDRARVDAGRSAEDARRWGEKLQADVASLMEELGREVQARRAADEMNAGLLRHQRALEVLPRWLVRVLMKISDGRS